MMHQCSTLRTSSAQQLCRLPRLHSVLCQGRAVTSLALAPRGTLLCCGHVFICIRQHMESSLGSLHVHEQAWEQPDVVKQHSTFRSTQHSVAPHRCAQFRS